MRTYGSHFFIFYGKALVEGATLKENRERRKL